MRSLGQVTSPGSLRLGFALGPGNQTYSTGFRAAYKQLQTPSPDSGTYGAQRKITFHACLPIARVRMSLFSLFRARFSGGLARGIGRSGLGNLSGEPPSLRSAGGAGRDLGARQRGQVFPVGPPEKWAEVGGMREESRGARELGGSPGRRRGGVLLPPGAPAPGSDFNSAAGWRREGRRERTPEGGRAEPAGAAPATPGARGPAATRRPRASPLGRTALRQGATCPRARPAPAKLQVPGRPGSRPPPRPPLSPSAAAGGDWRSPGQREALGASEAGGGSAPYCVAGGVERSARSR